VGRGQEAARRPQLPRPAGQLRQGHAQRRDPEQGLQVDQGPGVRPRGRGLRLEGRQELMHVGARHGGLRADCQGGGTQARQAAGCDEDAEPEAGAARVGCSRQHGLLGPCERAPGSRRVADPAAGLLQRRGRERKGSTAGGGFRLRCGPGAGDWFGGCRGRAQGDHRQGHSNAQGPQEAARAVCAHL